MSGSLKTPLPSPPNWGAWPLQKKRVSEAQCQAMVDALHALYAEYPLRPEELGLIAPRMEMISHAEKGWFMLMRRDCDGLSVPKERILALLTLLD